MNAAADARHALVVKKIVKWRTRRAVILQHSKQELRCIFMVSSTFYVSHMDVLLRYASLSPSYDPCLHAPPLNESQV